MSTKVKWMYDSRVKQGQKYVNVSGMIFLRKNDKS